MQLFRPDPDAGVAPRKIANSTHSPSTSAAAGLVMGRAGQALRLNANFHLALMRKLDGVSDEVSPGFAATA